MRIKKCLFPAAGYGTRFLPATKAVPKEMLPILTKPLLQYGIEEALEAGIDTMAIITGRGKRSIEDHFDSAFEIEQQLKNTKKTHYLKDINAIVNNATFTYIRQKKMLGLGHAILTGEPLIGQEPFAVLLADDLCINDLFKNNKNTHIGVLEQMLEIYDKYNCSVIAVEVVDKSKVHQYGIIKGKLVDNTKDTYRVNDMIEKPSVAESTSNLAIIGRYILTPDIFSILRQTKVDKNREIQITDALRIQAKRGKVIAYQFKGRRFDCGNVEGYVRAICHLAKMQNLL